MVGYVKEVAIEALHFKTETLHPITPAKRRRFEFWWYLSARLAKGFEEMRMTG